MAVWKLAEANYSQVRDCRYDVAVLPLGSTEPHNLHLPYGTDTFEANTLGERLCQFASDQGARVVLLPTIPYGTETNMRRFPLAINVNPSTLNQVITDIVQSVAASGIHKILLLNSHGGNDLKPLLRELYGQTEAHVFLCNWYQAIRDRYAEIFDNPDDHAGEMETSFALACFPQWVARTSEGKLAADDGAVRQFKFAALNEGWVTMTRPWDRLTTHSGSGNPHLASALKGRALISLLVERIGPFLVELAQANVDELFPFSE